MLFFPLRPYLKIDLQLEEFIGFCGIQVNDMSADILRRRWYSGHERLRQDVLILAATEIHAHHMHVMSVHRRTATNLVVEGPPAKLKMNTY